MLAPQDVAAPPCGKLQFCKKKRVAGSAALVAARGAVQGHPARRSRVSSWQEGREEGAARCPGL